MGLVAYLCLGLPAEEHLDPELDRHHWEVRADLKDVVFARARKTFVQKVAGRIRTRFFSAEPNGAHAALEPLLISRQG